MVISSKTEEQSLPITPAAPAPCTHRMSSPFPRKQERAGRGDRGPVHCTSLGEPSPSSAGAASLANPPGFPYPPPPIPAWFARAPAGPAMQRRPGCSRGWGGTQPPLVPSIQPSGASQPTLAPALQLERPSPPARILGAGMGGERG